MGRILFPMITFEERRLPFVMTSIGIQDNQEHITRPEGYNCYHWIHCSKGTGLLLIGGKEYVIQENMGFLFEKGIPHEYYALKEPWETHWITFEGFAVPKLIEMLGFKPWNVFHINGRQQLEKMLFSIYSSGVSRNMLRNYECSSLLYQFLLAAGNLIRGESSKPLPRVNCQLEAVMHLLEEGYFTQISLDDMADRAKVSKQHLCRLFRQTFNMSPFEYLTKFRIQKAKEIIMGSEGLKVKEVAKSTGFNDLSYFCSVFKKHEGFTPLQFKSMYRSV
jgi:AraC-like DNA-binding protein